jgi:hypothetical protein
MFIFSTLLALQVSCNSPMNHRLRSAENDNKSLGLAESRFTGGEWSARALWVEGPFGNTNQNNYLLVFLYKEGRLQSLPSGQTLNFYATMPSMGHPMEDAGFFQELDEGIYLNKSIRYNMPGDWKNELWIMDANLNIVDQLEWLIFF